MMNESKLLFTLTPEEAELLNDVLTNMIKDGALTFFDESKELIDNLLNRIKQWQDE